MKRDQHLFDAFVRQHYKGVFYYLATLIGDKHVAEDLTQETFLTAFRKMNEIEEIRDFGAWLRGIGRNLVMRQRERTGMLRFVLMERVQGAIEREFSADDDPSVSLWEERMAALRRCMRELRAEARKMVELYYVSALKAPEIAARIGIRADSVRRVLSNTREALGACIDRRLSKEQGQS